MCSRHTLHHPIGLLAQYFQAAIGSSASESFTPSYNIAPSHTGVVIVQEGERRIVTMESGLLSPNGNQPKRFINARSETIDILPTFRAAFRKRRCLIPMSGFYEPDHVTNSKHPYYFHLADDRPFTAAGIWEASQSPAGNVYSYSIVTVPANETVSTVHDRMPAILDDEAQRIWLDPTIEDPRILKSVLKPYDGSHLLIHRVSRSVYKNLSIGPECIEQVLDAPMQPRLF